MLYACVHAAGVLAVVGDAACRWSCPPEELHEMAGIGAASFPHDLAAMSDAMSITNRYFMSLYEAVKNQVTLLHSYCTAPQVVDYQRSG